MVSLVWNCLIRHTASLPSKESLPDKPCGGGRFHHFVFPDEKPPYPKLDPRHACFGLRKPYASDIRARKSGNKKIVINKTTGKFTVKEA
jgi:hypothetical protein